MSQLYRLRALLPDYYNDIFEMQQLVTAEQPVIDAFQEQLERAQNNMFVMLADKAGIAVFESMLNIVPPAGSSLESRRYSILLAMLPPQPLTEPYLREVLRLMNINAQAVIDGPNFSVTVTADPPDKAAAERLNQLLNNYLPANLGFTYMTAAKSPFYFGAVAQSDHVIKTVTDLAFSRTTTMAIDCYYGSLGRKDGVIKIETEVS